MTDARLREATTQEISTALAKLFRALPPRKASPEELLESYLIACHGCTKHAIETVVVKLIRGELDKLSKSFAPSSAELSAAIRDEMDFVVKQNALAQERMQLEDKRPVAAPVKLLHERIADAERQMAAEGRGVLFKVLSHSDMLSRRRDMPAGSVYMAILGAVYGPAGSSSAAQPPPIDDDIPW